MDEQESKPSRPSTSAEIDTFLNRIYTGERQPSKAKL